MTTAKQKRGSMVNVSLDVLDSVVPLNEEQMSKPEKLFKVSPKEKKKKTDDLNLFFDRHTEEINKIFAGSLQVEEAVDAGEGRETADKISKVVPGLVGIFYWAWKEHALGTNITNTHLNARVELAGEPGAKCFLRAIKKPGDPLYPLGGYVVETPTTTWLKPCFLDEVRLYVKKVPKAPAKVVAKVITALTKAPRKRRTKAEMALVRSLDQSSTKTEKEKTNNGQTPKKATSETGASPGRSRKRNIKE